MKVVALYSINGGVGKTSSAVNLAFIAARNGYRTLVWDLDPQGREPVVHSPRYPGFSTGFERDEQYPVSKLFMTFYDFA